MRIAVFGATGKIGRLVTEQLLGAGHEVTVLVRTPDKLTLDHPGLTVRTGQLSDAAAVRDVVAGSDAVISALGPSLKRGASATPLTYGTRAIVAAMRDAGVRRFIGLATPSVPDPRDGPTFKAKLLPLIAGVSFPNALTELRGMTAAVTDSELDWTLARITNPTDRPAKGTVRAGFLGRDAVGWAMTRADIAAFLVGQLTDTTYLRAAPAISN
jgi:nucleoside-diphosphate-sugar epimerase